MTNRKATIDVQYSGKRSILWWGGIAAVVIVVLAAVAVAWFHTFSHSASGRQQQSALAEAAAHYVSSEACVSCHAQEASQWRASQHHDAMQEANAQTVLADFNNTTFTYSGVTSKFFKRDGQFYVRTDGSDGKLTDYQIQYTYGLYPLQQYLIKFPDGRLQALSIAWDTRSKQQGGQRWFDLYLKEHITYKDELFWTKPSQNWNFMCADCHSTDVHKNYDAANNTFKTSWSEISVGCEACHGPGSRHVRWAQLKEAGKPVGVYENQGLTAQLDELHGVTWTIDAQTGNAVRSQPLLSDREIQVCAQCHSRRGQIGEGYEAGKPYLDYYRPAFLSAPLYYADGQQHGEVYKWGSFLQSRMYAHGVTCSDCHNPHTGTLRADGNAMCAKCHLPSKYDTEQHYHHKPGSAGAQCIACHMPTTNYMVVDPRHDHSIRIPRPDETVKYGVPNACNRCHTDRTAVWAAAQVKQWYGHDPQGYQRFAAAFAAYDTDQPGAQSQLRAVATDTTQPAIVRATAFSEMQPVIDQPTMEALVEGLRDPDPLVRLGALQPLANAPLNVRVQLVVPLLSDPLRVVRIEAASILAPVAAAHLDADAHSAFEHAAGEYMQSQIYNADRADARVNLGSFYAYQGNATQAEEEIKTAISLQPMYVPAYVNLADVYRAEGRDADGEQILQQGLKLNPDSATLHYALGLVLVRMQQTHSALTEFRRATTLDPGNARFAYVYAVALYSTGKSNQAIAILDKALQAHPNDRDILEALASYHQARGEHALAKKYSDRLKMLAEKDN
ncbi:MAG: tetratricopeptide repeat protein [Gammaproteobacteria bacterium]